MGIIKVFSKKEHTHLAEFLSTKSTKDTKIKITCYFWVSSFHGEIGGQFDFINGQLAELQQNEIPVHEKMEVRLSLIVR